MKKLIFRENVSDLVPNDTIELYRDDYDISTVGLFSPLLCNRIYPLDNVLKPLSHKQCDSACTIYVLSIFRFKSDMNIKYTTK